MTEELIADGPVLLSLDDGVARLRLNRPDASNGLSEDLLEALVEATAMCEETEGIRCVLLSGEGENFCAGATSRSSPRRARTCPTTSSARRPCSRGRPRRCSA